MKDIKIKQKILNSLSGKIEVTKIERNNGDAVILTCEFIKNGKSGSFNYTLEGDERGIDWIRGYGEEDDEDIYRDIHDWVNEHIKWRTSIKLDGEEICQIK